ncbi:MAG: preprotein translocase subunit SecE [Vicinamibacteria bacterium]|nr:preprotein translocase subunit SecE [Vicinamibacteria bacterium]
MGKRSDTAIDKGAQTSSERPAWLAWAPNKAGELKAFVTEVKSELKKVTWPGRQEVRSTTIVVILTTVFFGFYLWALDVGFSQLMSLVLR